MEMVGYALGYAMAVTSGVPVNGTETFLVTFKDVRISISSSKKKSLPKKTWSWWNIQCTTHFT